MQVDLELSLDERREDRVLVSLWLTPQVPEAAVDSVSLQLVCPKGTELCPRTLLPLSGRVTGPVALSVELRGEQALPLGSQVVATAWVDGEPLRAHCPADPSTDLRGHLVGARLGMEAVDADLVTLTPLDDAGRAHLEARWPWVAEPTAPPEVAGVLEAEEDPLSAEDLAADLGLDEEDAAWLRDLLDEE